MPVFQPRPLPKSLETLTELALDLRWTWSHGADALWQMLDQASWERTENPWMLLQNMSLERLQQLADSAVSGCIYWIAMTRSTARVIVALPTNSMTAARNCVSCRNCTGHRWLAPAGSDRRGYFSVSSERRTCGPCHSGTRAPLYGTIRSFISGIPVGHPCRH